MDMFRSYGHIKKPNLNHRFFTILSWLSLFNSYHLYKYILAFLVLTIALLYICTYYVNILCKLLLILSLYVVDNFGHDFINIDGLVIFKAFIIIS